MHRPSNVVRMRRSVQSGLFRVSHFEPAHFIMERKMMLLCIKSLRKPIVGWRCRWRPECSSLVRLTAGLEEVAVPDSWPR